MASALPRALFLLYLCLCGPGQAADIVVGAARDGDVLLIHASADFEGTIAGTWQVLTDYDRLADFIPHLRTSRVTARTQGVISVEQRGEARLLLFSYPIEVTLAVTETPYSKVVSRAVAGNFKEMSGTYTLESQDGRVRLHYAGRMAPDFYVPPLIGTWVLRYNVEATFGALVDEIIRRQRQARPPDASTKQ